MAFDDDLESTIRDVIKSTSAEPAAAPVVEAPAPAVETPEATDAPPENETAAEKQARIDATGRAHDEKGKFTAKPKAEGEGEPKSSETKDAAPAEPKAAAKTDEKPLAPPAHWKPQAKADFVNAPRAVQEQILAREEEMENGRKEWSTKAEEYNQLAPVLNQNRDRWAVMGMNPATAVTRLLQAEQAIMNDPVKGITALLTGYHRGQELQIINQMLEGSGYALAKATNQGTPTEGLQPAQADPTVRRFEETIQQQAQQLRELSEKLNARETAEQQSSLATMQAEIQAVATDPKNLYYENLKDKIAALVSIGDRTGDKRPIRVRVQEAYDQAAYADPTTRSLILQAEQRTRDEEARKAAAAKAEAARKASGSIHGSPGNGTPVVRSGPTGSNSYEESVRQAYAASRA